MVKKVRKVETHFIGGSKLYDLLKKVAVIKLEMKNSESQKL
jgi:hypothetical protein